VVKRITSMTSESANDKIARSIRAEGILFVRHLFALAESVSLVLLRCGNDKIASSILAEGIFLREWSSF
jgi:hypothetical protein